MARLVTLGALALLAVAEVAAVLALVDALGTATALLVLGLDMLLGMVIMNWAARGPVDDRGWRIAAGAFVALPGLVLDLVGVLLLVPATRSWLKARVARGTESALRRRGVSVITVTDPSGVRRSTVVPGDIIAGEVVDTGDPAPATPTDRADGTSEPGPRVVRGEIAGPEEESSE
jgi:UPF0716 family protein affecting phage T7 exclusion